jgi:hypothetical protein
MDRNLNVFTEIKVGDRVKCYDEYTHDYNEHEVIVTNIDYESEYATETNPKGMICYGDDVDKEYWGDEYIETVTESNFTRIMRTHE